MTASPGLARRGLTGCANYALARASARRGGGRISLHLDVENAGGVSLHPRAILKS